MKKFINDFVPEYDRILSRRNESKNRINGHFYFKNVFLVMLIGLGSMYLIGVIMNLLTSKSFIYYGTNVVVLISLFLFYYTKELYLKSGQKEDYNIWIGILHDYCIVTDMIVFIIVVLMYTFLRPYFTVTEILITTVGYVLYFIGSIVLKKQVANVLYAFIIGLGLLALLLLFQEIEVYIQYPLSVLILVVICTIKNKVDLDYYRMPNAISVLVGMGILIFVLIAVREQSVNDMFIYAKPGLEFHKTSEEDIKIIDGYTDENYIYYYTEEQGTNYIIVMDYQWNEVLRINTTENDMFLYVFKLDRFYGQKVDENGLMEYYKMNDDLEFEKVDEPHIPELPVVVGYEPISMDNEYLHYVRESDPFAYEQPRILKRVGNSYQVLFDLDPDLHEYNMYRMEQFGDYFLFFGTINDKKQMFLYDMNGEIVSSYSEPGIFKRGTQTPINNGSSGSTGNYVHDIFYLDNEEAYIMLMKDGIYQIDRLTIDNFTINTGTENYVFTGLILLIGYLLLPIRFRKVGS